MENEAPRDLPATATRLTEARKAAGMSQLKLAATASVPQTVISDIETAKVRSSRHVFALARALGVDPSWLAGVSDERIAS